MQKLVLIVALFAVSSVFGQEKPSAKPSYVVIPTGDVVLAVASQPDCPLRIDNSRLLYNVTSNRLEYEYDIRNEGKKVISGFLTEAWHLNGTGGTLHDDWNDKRQLLLPGQSFRSDEYKDSTFVPYTKEIREKLKIGKETRMLILLVVREVWFGDGTKYDGNKDVDMIKGLFEKLGDSSEILN
jgi:hypothetical protein